MTKTSKSKTGLFRITIPHSIMTVFNFGVGWCGLEFTLAPFFSQGIVRTLPNVLGQPLPIGDNLRILNAPDCLGSHPHPQ